jgi:transposase
MDGKSDRLDAEQIARAVLGQTSTATPKTKSGTVEVIRTLRVTRASAVKARTQAFNTLWGVMIGAPSPLRDELVVLTKKTLVNRCLRLRPETDDLLSLTGDPARLLLAAVKTSLRDLARRWKALDEEAKALSRQIDLIVRAAAPELVQLHGVGVEIAGQFWSPPATTLTASAARQPSPSSAVSPRSPRAAAVPAAGTDSAAAATEPPTARFTSSPSSGCVTTSPPATMWNGAPPKD